MQTHKAGESGLKVTSQVTCVMKLENHNNAEWKSYCEVGLNLSFSLKCKNKIGLEKSCWTGHKRLLVGHSETAKESPFQLWLYNVLWSRKYASANPINIGTKSKILETGWFHSVMN